MRTFPDLWRKCPQWVETRHQQTVGFRPNDAGAHAK